MKRFYWEKKFILKKRSVSNGTEYDSLLTTVGQIRREKMKNPFLLLRVNGLPLKVLFVFCFVVFSFELKKTINIRRGAEVVV